MTINVRSYKIEFLLLSTRPMNCINKERQRIKDKCSPFVKLDTINDLTKMWVGDLFRIPALGRLSVREIEIKLLHHGLRFAESPGSNSVWQQLKKQRLKKQRKKS